MTLVAAVPPKETVAPLVKLVPVIVTVVPPPVGPLVGKTEETVGAGGSVVVVVTVVVVGGGVAVKVKSAPDIVGLLVLGDQLIDGGVTVSPESDAVTV